MISTDKLAIAIREEVVEVPRDGALISASFEIRVNRMHFSYIDVQLLIERHLVKSIGKLGSDKVLDVVFRAGLLAKKLVARKE